LLSIGEFAAATQLSPKALRIYDDQQLLIPARIDTATGYRLYRSDQVLQGRLIRTLREMGLSLAAISSVISSRSAGAELVLAELARELENRYAGERRAYHAALLLLHDARPARGPEIIERMRDQATMVVQSFVASRIEFIEKFRTEAQALQQAVVAAGMTLAGGSSCALVDPLSDEEGRLEVFLPVRPAPDIPNGLTLRQLPAAPCAVITNVRHHAADLAGALDAMFDWFDRRAYRAIEKPLVRIDAGDTGLETEIEWAFERTDS
jgi:DNA-binding transcriptional MerR regulator